MYSYFYTVFIFFSISGKTMENIFKRINVELVNTKRRMQKLCAKPNFQSFKIFNHDLVAVNLKKTNLVFNKPTYVGFSILDISKLFMYRFHYDYMKVKYDERAQLLFTDTDSLTYLVETDDIYRDMSQKSDIFYTSNYHHDHPLHDMTNAKALGKMKDETAGNPIQEFVGLKPKMYSLIYQSSQNNRRDITEKKTAKGVSKVVIEKELKHRMHKDCLNQEKTMKHDMNFIRSELHQLYSVTVNKTTVSPYDDKRYILDDGIHTLAYGHCRIKT